MSDPAGSDPPPVPDPPPTVPEGREPSVGCPHEWLGPFEDDHGVVFVQCLLCRWALPYVPRVD